MEKYKCREGEGKRKKKTGFGMRQLLYIINKQTQTFLAADVCYISTVGTVTAFMAFHSNKEGPLSQTFKAPQINILCEISHSGDKATEG